MYTVNKKQFSPYLTQFPGYVRNGWFKSADPSAIVTCQTPWGLEIWNNNNLNCRIVDNDGAYEWKFKIITKGYTEYRQLCNIALVSDDHRCNFFLKPVLSNGMQIGLTNGQEWQNFESYDESRDIQEYESTIVFTANTFGTYRQNVVFGFGGYPVILRRLCVDYMPVQVYMKMIEITSNQIWDIPEESSNEPEFTSILSKIPHSSPRTMKLSQIYPFPDKHNLFLTQDTLIDNWITSQNYRGRMHELITLEELAQQTEVSKYNQVSYMYILKEYTVDIGLSSFTRYANAGELFAQCTINRDMSEDTKSGRIFMKGCNTVLLRLIDNNDCIREEIFDAHIHNKCMQSIYIKLNRNCVQSWKLSVGHYVQVQLRFVLNRLPFREWHLAVDSLENLDGVLFNKRFEKVSIGTVLRNTVDIPKSLLNTAQRHAAAVMMSRSKDIVSPILLMGPFGTGKTFTVAQVLRLLVQDENNKIILCTHSNSSADLYITEFFDVWYKMDRHPRLKPVRVYYRERYLYTVDPVVQEYCLMDHKRGLFRNPTQSDFRNCGLIVTTLANSSHLIGMDISPTHIFVDEAAQAIECEALIALRLANSDTRIILTGDLMQLKPEVYSKLAKNRGFGISLLEKINTLYPKEHPCLLQLNESYRAHRDIIAYMSDMFYGEKIQCSNKLLLAHPIMKPLTFYAVYGFEIKGEYQGYIHYLEAQELVNRVLELKNSWPTDRWGPYDNGSIGVLSHYTEQVQILRLELRKHNLEEISVLKVINAQGKQFTAVFISIVHTHNCFRDSPEDTQKDFGFLSNPCLLNTALSRARCFVAVVGDPNALLSSGPCQNYWKKYLDLADLHGIDRRQSSPSLNPLAKEFIPRSSLEEEHTPSNYYNQVLMFQYLPLYFHNNLNNEFYY